jgi:DNA damage-binding protein 1
VDRVLVLDDAEGMSRAFTFELHPLEQSLACECFTFGGSTEYFVVGTAANLPEDGDPTRGRVLVFEIQSDKSLVLRVEQELKGAVFSLAAIGNRLVVGVGSKVQVLKFAESEEAGGSVELLTECVVSGQILSLFVKARGDQVLLGDIMCSLSVLRWQEAEGKLREEARDFSANMIRAIEFIDDHHYLASDDCGNLLALSGDSGSMEGDRTRLGLCAEFHLGEYVNVLRRGVLNSQPRDMAAVNADAYGVSLLYGCVSGCIGAVIGLPEDAYQLLSALQKCLKGAIEGIGGLTHDDYRNFQNERRSGSQLGALDGDLLEQFLELSREKMEEIVLQLNFELRLGAASKPDSTEALKDAGMEVLGEQQFSLTVSDVIKKVEELASLH